MESQSSYDRVWTLPNLLSMARIILALLAAVMFLRAGEARVLPALICVFAAFLDLLDGYIARRTGQITRLGEHLDPFADKVLTSVIFLALAFFVSNVYLTIIVVLLLLREWGITWVREHFQQRHGLSFPAGKLGKWKMLSQAIFGNAYLVWLALAGQETGPLFLPTIFAALLIVLSLALISAARYLQSIRRAQRSSP